VDWSLYYQTNKGRLLGIGSILIILGLILYFARGNEATLVLPVVGIVLLIIGVIYKPRKKTENVANEAQ
jgi:membrane-bound ClpP family serine protease